MMFNTIIFSWYFFGVYDNGFSIFPSKACVWPNKFTTRDHWKSYLSLRNINKCPDNLQSLT